MLWHYLLAFALWFIFEMVGLTIAIFWDAFDEWAMKKLPAEFWMIMVYLMTWPIVILWFLVDSAFSIPEEGRPSKPREYDNHGSE